MALYESKGQKRGTPADLIRPSTDDDDDDEMGFVAMIDPMLLKLAETLLR